MEIRSAQNVGRVLISRNNSLRNLFGVVFDIFSGGVFMEELQTPAFFVFFAYLTTLEPVLILTKVVELEMSAPKSAWQDLEDAVFPQGR